MKQNNLSTPIVGSYLSEVLCWVQVVVEKTVLLTNFIWDVYKGCFRRIYIFSPSINVDQTWAPVKKYIEDHDLCGEEETCLFDHYDPEELENIIETQRKVVEYMKKKKKKNFIRFWFLWMTSLMTPALVEIQNFYIVCLLGVVIRWSPRLLPLKNSLQFIPSFEPMQLNCMFTDLGTRKILMFSRRVECLVW